MADAFNKRVRGVLVALAHRDVENQFRVALDCNEGIGVAKVLVIFRPHALLLLADEGPQFITFHVAHFDVADLLGHDALALLAREYKQLQDGRVMDIGNALHGRNRVAFEQKLQNHFGLLDRQIHAFKRLPPEVLDFFRKQGAKGGKIGGTARAANMTAEQRSDASRKAVQAHWSKISKSLQSDNL